MSMRSTLVTSHYGIGAPSSAPTDLHIFLAYENLAAALRASEALAVLSQKDLDGLMVKLSPWSFASLAEPRWRAQATSHIWRANLMVIAVCSTTPRLPAWIEAWLRSCLEQPRVERLAVAAHFHYCDNDGPDGATSPRLRAVQRIVLEAGCPFFAPGVRDDIAIPV